MLLFNTSLSDDQISVMRLQLICNSVMAFPQEFEQFYDHGWVFIHPSMFVFELDHLIPTLL